jgi:hypothetical protein
MSVMLVNETIERCRETLQHLDTSRRRLVHSRRLLTRAWWMAGGSDDDIRLTIRQRLVTGGLFPAPDRIWAGKGIGPICIVCERAISSPDVENEMIAGPVTFWASRPTRD